MINRIQGNYNLNHSTVTKKCCVKRDSRNKLMSVFQEVKERLQDQKEKLKEQNLSSQEILEKTKEIDEQIKEIDLQMNQLIEKSKKDEEEKLAEKIREHNEEENLKNKDEEEIEGVIVSGSLSYVIKNNNLHKSISKIKELKSRYGKSSGIGKRIDMEISNKLKEINKNAKKSLSFIQKTKEEE